MIEVSEDRFSYHGIVIRGNNKEIRLVTFLGAYESREKAIKELKEILK